MRGDATKVSGSITRDPSEVFEGAYELAINAFGSRPQARFTKAWRRCRNSINNYDFFLKNLPIQAANIGPNIPAIAPAKPIITYSCQPLVNKFRSNIRFSKYHIKAVNAHTMKKANKKVMSFFITRNLSMVKYFECKVTTL